MYSRTEYQMNEEQLKVLMDACQPVICIALGGIAPRSQQENANSAWSHLGEQMGFDSMTVKLITGKGMEFFTAIPTEKKENFKRIWQNKSVNRNKKSGKYKQKLTI